MRRKVKKQKRPTDQSVRRLRLAVHSVAPYNFQTAHDAVAGVRTEQEAVHAQKSIRLGILSMKTAVDEIRLSNRAPLSCNAVSVHGF